MAAMDRRPRRIPASSKRGAILFRSDAVFMAPNNPSAIGTDALRTAYTGIFKTITFDTELQVEEIVQVAPDWAFVRTSSAGFVTIHAIGRRVPIPTTSYSSFTRAMRADGRSLATRFRRRTRCPNDQAMCRLTGLSR